MDAGAHPAAAVAISAVSCHKPAELDRCLPSRASTVIAPNVTQTRATPAASGIETFAMDKQIAFTALVGTLSLRAIRAQSDS
jgi:hypothetical protein